MPRRIPLSKVTEDFFEYWRMRYVWPLDRSREQSENEINELSNQAETAIRSADERLLENLLVKIHRWKTRNRSGITDDYQIALANSPGLVRNLKRTLLRQPSLNSDIANDLIGILRVENSNLPVCTAQVSFLSGRRFPILDRFVGQFFAQVVSRRILELPMFDMREVFRDIRPIPFIIEDDGSGKCKPRLAVYHNSNYERNRELFIHQLIPELDGIAKALNNERVGFRSVNGEPMPFSSVDVEMAVFAFGTQNKEFFQCFYGESRPSILRVDTQ